MVSVMESEDLLDNLSRHRGGHAAAGLAAFDHDGQRNLGMIIGSKGQKPGMIVLLSATPKLSGPGFSGNLNTRNRALLTGPVISVDHLPHSFSNEFNLVFGKIVVFSEITPDFGRPACDRAVRLLDLMNQGGLVINSAVCDRGNDHRHLQRTGEYVTLTNGCIRGLTLRPTLTLRCLQPFRRRQQTWILVGQLNPAGLTQPKCFADTIDRINSGCVPELIEIGVTGMSDRLDQILLPMHAPAMHVGVAIRHATRTGESGIGADSGQSSYSGIYFIRCTIPTRTAPPLYTTTS